MEVFLHNLPDQASEEQLKTFLGSILNNLSINAYCCRKLRKRGCATVTFLFSWEGERFLGVHAARQLRFMTRKVYAQTSSNKPDAFVLKLLREEAKAAQAPYSLPLRPGKAEKVLGRRHGFSSFFCGLWEYDKSALVFRPYYQQLTGGTVQFTKNSFVLESGANHLEVLYSAIYSVTTGTIGDFSLTVTLLEAPRTYEKIDGATSVAASRANGPQQPKWARVSSVNPDHDSVFSSCMVYRILFRDAALAVSSTLKKVDGLPPATLWPTRVLMPKNPFAKRLSQISEALATRYDNIPFVLKFQMQRLVQSGFLSPLRVLELLPELSAMVSRSSLAICLGALRRLFSQIPFPGPESEAEDLGLDALVKLIRMNEASTRRETQFIKDKPNQNRALILKAMVTPVGIYLDGPELDPMNRVLRLYSDFLDYFLKVTFAEEDGEALRFSRKVTNEYIFESRFKKVLDGVINVAGRGFEFLGFSHSSLRTRSCWFMAPFTWKGELLHARLVIKRLGDFSGIRSPAKCAARIGQAFSDTSVAITVPSGCFKEIQDIERNGRVFSDGVGVISSSIQHRICQKYALSSGLKPTLYQIRYRGAKGMISIDSRLRGDTLALRPSMIKFSASDANDIEICNSAIRPLPMYLNRSLIKILEDLGVPDDVFLELQETAVERLRMVTRSSINASTFFTRSRIGIGAQLPWFIRKLEDIGLPFQLDSFLRHTLELAVLIQLRNLKYRARIFVEEAVTLLGIMDETGILNEGEVYCVTETEEEGRYVKTGIVAVTRAPALHPGDVQVVRAVDVPPTSSLNALHNCIVFSQKGARDLPSQLSGGDLDGDLYNIIYKRSLLPRIVSKPADYPRLPSQDIGEEVKRKHMTDFFTDFMKNDQLGRIANLHQAVADQKDEGTFHPDCLLLAEKASTAVDFSKTGIRVDLRDMPKDNRYRPDFMAPGPRIELVEGKVDFNSANLSNQENEDEDESLVASRSSFRHYRSKKILGKLYRAIDEQDFFAALQNDSQRLINASSGEKTLMQRLWAYAQHQTVSIQWLHHRQWALEVKEMYEGFVVDTMSQYSLHPLQYLTELEVFVGDIVGRFGPPSQRQRDASIDMKTKFEADIAYITSCITKDEETGATSDEALPKSIACLSAAMSESSQRRHIGHLQSFAYVAAAVCLKEIDRFHKVGISDWT